MKHEALILSVKHLQGTGKNGQPYNFYAGIMIIDGIQFDFTSNKEVFANTEKKQVITITGGKVSI